jgi:hypothetical protein
MFQVPKHYVTQIDLFSTTFSLPPSKDSKDGIEGHTEQNPLILHQIPKQDFKAFLKVLVFLYVFHKCCPRAHRRDSQTFSRQIPYSYSNILKDEWISTLKLSTMWEVATLRDLAIRHLVNHLDAVKLVLLGAEYRVSQWFIDGCTKLINRSQGLTEEEGNQLGVNLIVKIVGIRERMFSLRIERTIKGSAPHLDCERAVREGFPDKI